MKKTVTFVEFTVYDRVLPLVSGYLQAYAQSRPEIRNSFQFATYSTTRTTGSEFILSTLLVHDADIYAFSCYVWNAALVRQVVAALTQAKPQVQIIIGGPQVMHNAADYLNKGQENVVICNGEGEITFSNYLLQLTQPHPDLAQVPGLSFYRDAELITTQPQARVADLNAIPSPFLNGCFEGQHSIAILETNRGCPFRCSFCFWGAATNDRVYKFDEGRVLEELTWVSRNNVVFLYLADANWGMLKRDERFSRHIGDCKRKYGLPSTVYFSASKNKPSRVTGITEILHTAGVITSQPVSMQTLNQTALSQIDRENIKLSSFRTLQKSLTDKGMNTIIELIWPLPGETLQSFTSGIDDLCSAGADTIIVYPHLLLRNTPMYRSRGDFGLKVEPTDGAASEAEMVVATSCVDHQEFDEGLWLFYATHILHNARTLRHVCKYLQDSGRKSHTAIFKDFAAFCQANPASRLGAYCQWAIETRQYDTYGALVHLALHEHRRDLEKLLWRFAQSQGWLDDEYLRGLFELDLIDRPFVYSNTAIEPPIEPLTRLRLKTMSDRSYVVEVPQDYLGLIRGNTEDGAAPQAFRVDHKRMQYPQMKRQGAEHSAAYCHGMISRSGNIVPIWTLLEGSQAQPG